jgi:hypothetical protein
VKDGATRALSGIEWRIVPGLLWRSTLAFAVGVPYIRFRVEQANELEARSRYGLGAGLRLQEVFDPFDLDPGRSSRKADVGQLACEPFLQYLAPQRGFLARAGLLLALDAPLGPAVDRGKVATLRIALGATW